MPPKFIFSLGLFASLNLFAAQGYRLVHATPRDFASAIVSPYSPPAKNQKPTSRLEKFFRIREKIVDGSTVTLNIFPNVPLLGSLFDGMNLITIKTVLLKQTEDTYLYDLKFKTTFDVSASMLVEPHPLGSLVTITTHEATTKLASAVFKTILAMGFLTEKPEAGGEPTSGSLSR